MNHPPPPTCRNKTLTLVVSILTLATTGIGQAAPESKGGPQPPAPAKAEKQSPDEVAAGMGLEKRSTKEITSDGRYVLELFKASGKTTTAMFGKRVGKATGDEPQYTVLDILALPPLSKNQFVSEFASFKDRNDDELFGIGLGDDSDSDFKPCVKVWRANVKTGKFEEAPTKYITISLPNEEGYEPEPGKDDAGLTTDAKPGQTGAESVKKPGSARIIAANGVKTEPPAGNVEIVYADGSTDRWTTKGTASDPKIAANGNVGWYVCATDAKGGLDLEEGGTPVPVSLVVCRAGKILATIKELTNPRDWAFDPDGAHVMVCEGAKHGPGWVRRFAISNGRETGQFSFADIEDPAACPEWARPFFEK